MYWSRTRFSVASLSVSVWVELMRATRAARETRAARSAQRQTGQANAEGWRGPTFESLLKVVDVTVTETDT